MKSSTRFRRLWGMPLLLALCTIIGLISALVGDGIWDVLSWFLLSAPLVAAIFLGCSTPKSRGR
jgi:hypothetical protein